MSGAILVISGPSGAGKSSLCSDLLKEIDNIYFSISTTTRALRGKEVDGVSYHFVSKEQFELDIKNGAFLEWAEVHNNYYGTKLAPIEKALQENKLVVFDIDVQGHDSIIKKLAKVTTSVFITTKNRQILKDRLIKRATDSDSVVQKRLEGALYEMNFMGKYDYIIINDDYKKSLDTLVAIAKVSKAKSSLFDIENLIQEWNNF